MILGLLKFIIIAILALILIGVVFILGVFHSLSNIRKKFSDLGAGSRTYTHHGKGNNGKETVIDNRPRNEASRKIFADDEGEYVDFEEEK